MQLSPLIPSSITLDDISHLGEGMVNISVLRLDKLHAEISGNKWFKLRFYLEEAKAKNKKNIVTFGGAWSNHLLATAAACQLYGLGSTGIVRGEEPSELSYTLTRAKELGMKLVFSPRDQYKEKEVPTGLLTAEDLLVPEGGYGKQGARGAATILDHCPNDFTYYCCAVGTGTMMAGVINAISESRSTAGTVGTTTMMAGLSGGASEKHVIGISALKNNRELDGMISGLVTDKDSSAFDKAGRWQLIGDYHFGGYAKYNAELLDFMNDFYQKTGIATDFVYTGKLFYAVLKLIRENFFPKGSKILVIHSGGLQGNRSLRKGTLIF